MTREKESVRYTRRQFMEYELIMGGASHDAAREAVRQGEEQAGKAMDFDKEFTWHEWVEHQK